jgi:hypothetical protein
LTSARICEGVKTIYKWAFQSCKKLETVSLPASLEYAGAYAFGYCDNLKVIECNGTTPPTVNSIAFSNSDIAKISVCVPSGSVDAYRNADVWKNFKNIGTYPAGIHIINGKNFTVNSGSKVKLTAGLTPHDAVSGIVWTSSNTGIASVVDGTVTAHAEGEAVITATTDNGIFKDSCRITVKTENNVSPEKDIFQDWKSAKHITIPVNYTLRDGIFANYSSLETVTVGDNVFFGKEVFRDCRNLKSITFLGKINEVTEGMFRGCTGIKLIRIPDGVTSIGNDAFNFCSQMLAIDIPNSVTSIGERTFRQSGLTLITIPGSVKKLPFAMCSYNGNLTSVTLCEGVKIVGDAAFQTCGKLEKISLPASLEYVYDYAFGRNPNIRIIECNGTTPPVLHPEAFISSDLTNVTVYVPHGSVDAYRNAPVWKDIPNIVASPPAANK